MTENGNGVKNEPERMSYELKPDMEAQKDGITYETGVALKVIQNIGK